SDHLPCPALPRCAYPSCQAGNAPQTGFLSNFKTTKIQKICLRHDKLLFSGSRPVPRYDYKPSPPNGCGSPLFGVQFDIGIPSMTRCCNHHDRCYDTCGNKKNDCDEQFQTCLSKICRDVQKTLGISESVQACESTVQLLFDAVIHLGCKPYLDSQRAACMCRYEGKTDL
uniref:Group XIIA secretory phospholipase A2 n=1 Tax=Zosterops lateralis melanops TaxID=1220523 RepID=A0A8D2NUJ9_ZOSLA